MTTSHPNVRQAGPGRLFLILGLGLTALGVLGYAVQLTTQRLTAPWYMPCLATLGAICVGMALRQGRTFGRLVALILVVMFAGATWVFLFATRLPAYSGPVAVDEPFPAFATARADGTPFTQRDLEGPSNSIFVFFRGRW